MSDIVKALIDDALDGRAEAWNREYNAIHWNDNGPLVMASYAVGAHVYWGITMSGEIIGEPQQMLDRLYGLNLFEPAARQLGHLVAMTRLAVKMKEAQNANSAARRASGNDRSDGSGEGPL